MANEPISALTLFTSYSTADEVEILDVSDTTFASTGTNKRIQFSTLLTMAGVGTVAGGGTGLTAVGSADQLVGVAHTGGALEYKTLTAGPNVTITPAAGSITIAASGGGGSSGTVTSVGLSLPPFITVTGSPVSTSGTLTGTLATQTANTHFAGPTSGSAAAPTFRALVATDIPSLPASQITSGQISVAQGGTGLASLGSGSQLLGVNTSATALEYKTLTAGSNITITPAAGAITIAAAGGGGLAIGNAVSGGTASAVLYGTHRPTSPHPQTSNSTARTSS